jgi:hypothetical protein
VDVDLVGQVTDDLGGFRVQAFVGQCDQGAWSGCPLQQGRALIVSQSLGSFGPCPPPHKKMTALLVGVISHRQYLGSAFVQNREKLAGLRGDELPGGCQAPFLKVSLKYEWGISHPMSTSDQSHLIGEGS